MKIYAVRSMIIAFSSSSSHLFSQAFQTCAYPNTSSPLRVFVKSSKRILQSQSNQFPTVCHMNHINNHNQHNSTMENRSSELQTQWAEGIDVWPKVPVLNTNTTNITTHTAAGNTNTTNGNISSISISNMRITNYIPIQTKVVPNNTTTTSSLSSSSSKSLWPDVVTSRILYGFGAYNPRGTVLPNDINMKQHEKLRQDIIDSLSTYPDAIWWEGASVWQDGSSERGFILAFSKDNAEQGLQLSVHLATKYNQGAIYKFEYEQEKLKLIRNTIAVLDKGTDASVQVEMDDSPLHVNPFE